MGSRSFPFQKAVFDRLLERIAEGEALTAICRDSDMPSVSTVFNWLERMPELVEAYTRAREVQAETLAYEGLEIADTPEEGTTEKLGANGLEITTGDMLGHRKLRIDQRRWMAGKLAPKKYGDKQFVEHSGSITLVDASDDELLAELRELMASGKVPQLGSAELVEDADDFSDLA